MLPNFIGKWTHVSCRVTLSNKRQSIYQNRTNDSSNYGPLAIQERDFLSTLNNRVFSSALATVITIILGMALPHPAQSKPSSCSPQSSGTITCSGNQSAGIASGSDFSSPPFITVNVNNLTTDITPSSGKSGITLQNTGATGSDGGFGSGSIFGSGPAGGAGGLGRNNTVNFVGGGSELKTQGNNARGIFVSSRGGNGGDGGWATGFPIPPIFILTGPAFGGDGGNARNGGRVTVNSDGSITTNGANAQGIRAESRGGNGGRGGWAFSTTAAEGGDGGAGASGGTVIVINKGTITTHGRDSEGIFARSTGGKGGAGGEGDGLFGIGGAGEGTGNGGSITINNSGVITTNGAKSEAILANSTGGGGGDGGGAGGIFTFGGDGASAGHGGTVKVTNSGDLNTTNGDSTGILAQSFGGGGGNGGGAISGGFVSAAFGGSGGPGGNGGTVIYNETANINNLTATTIKTSGDRSHGIQMESVGGGGGNGGFAFAGSAGGGISASFALGGRGGDGGRGGAVTVNEKGTVTTGGEGAIGIFAQSVGGGGGNGGGTVAASVGGAYNLSVAIGGKGGGGGNGNIVTVNTVGNISTAGAQSHAILAQSVGGGGGNGGYSVAASAGGLSGSVGLGGTGGAGGIGSTVIVNTSGTGFVNPTISTSGQGAIGILAQSVGGGGGNGGLAGTISAGSGGVGVSLGGSGGGGAIGGTVTVTNRNIIKTTGNGASAIFAQSVGGGGGNGGAALSGAGGVVGISVAVGGRGGSGSNGGTVTVNNFGSITTGSSMESTVGGVTVRELFGNRSYGIFAQSVGGGGGNGGFAIAGAVGVSIPNVPGGAAAISVGGKGGGASNGGQVTVNNHGGIETFALGSHAIFAQSVGGGGGNGGLAGSVAMTVGSGASVGVAVGGGGSGGGNAGIVNVNTFDALQSIITHADGADGIHAQSVGGGGGDGGFAMSGAFGFSKATSVNVAVAIGGAGGKGGMGNEVNVTNRQTITTFGENSNGIMAQSVGGGGGNGGMAVTGTLTFAQTAGAVGVTVGGGGGTGSIGKTVTVDNHGQITTSGNDAIGILAQSVGGSGGNGGLSVAAQMTGTTRKSATVGVSIGGDGGNGNIGGVVNVTNHSLGTIETNGLGAHGIKAQSIGGGGGNGGMAIVAQLGQAGGTADQATKTLNVGVSVGGKGGTGGSGNTVHVINDGSITVGGETGTGAAATGIFAQSVGGGGGDGGGAVSAIGMLSDSANSDSRSLVASVTVGGAGGSANIGGTVMVDNTGSVVTRGVSGHGIYAQSIGGGGGVGGRANTIQMVVTKPVPVPGADEVLTNKNNVQLGVTIGGNGGTGGHGGKVVVTNKGEIETWNQVSSGIFAQSVGGGGGDGGNGAIGTDGLLPIPGGKTILDKSVGLFGVKGSVKFLKQMDVAVGGNSLASGNGGTVTVDNNKNITTHGSNSDGIFAQSVGGGGGVGGKAVIGLKGKIGIGGKGGAAGNGDIVTVKQTDGATIETFGVASNGIFAQSLGGGGGIAGNVDRFLANGVDSIPGITIPSINVGIGLALGQGGGNGGSGKLVDIDVDGTIITHGDSSAGIFAHSVGGGGGLLGELGNDLPVLSQLSWAIGSNGDAGDAGQVDVDLTGTIMTAGNNATGIFAQSAAGTGTAGAVNVTLNSSILTGEVLQAGDEDRGLGSIGILAQSVAVDNANNGNITVAINSPNGIVRGGRSKVIDVNREYIGVGIWLMDGANNIIINNGLVTTHGGVENGFAILATGSDATHPGGNETIDNFGTIIGNISLGAGTNSFNNRSGGTFVSGAHVDVGGTLTNGGKFSPGDDENILTADLTGDLVQSGTGTYFVDLDLENGAHDRINVSGTAGLDGEASVNIVNDGFAKPGTYESTIVSGAGGVTDSGIGLDSAASVVVGHELFFNATDAVLRTNVDFSPKGVKINGNQAGIGEYINEIQLAGGSPEFAPIVAALIAQPDAESLAAAYNQLSPEVFTGPQTKAFLSNLDFSNAMLSCRERAGEYRFVREGECRWMRFTGRNLEREATSSNLGFDELTFGFSGGMQWQISDHHHIGFGLSYENSNLEVDGLSDTEGDQLQGGLILKGRYGATIFSAALSGGFGWYDSTRFVNLPVPGIIARSDQGIGFVSSHVRVAQVFERTGWYLLPMMDIGVTYVNLGGFTETGAGAANLIVEKHSETYFSFQPALEVGAEFAKENGTLIRPFVKVGLNQFVGDSTPEISAVFQGAPAGVAPFTVTGDIDETFGEVTVGLDLLGVSGVVLRLNYEGRFSANTEQHGGSLKIKAPF